MSLQVGQLGLKAIGLRTRKATSPTAISKVAKSHIPKGIEDLPLYKYTIFLVHISELGVYFFGFFGLKKKYPSKSPSPKEIIIVRISTCADVILWG